MSTPVSSVVMSIDVMENPKSSSQKTKKKLVSGSTVISVDMASASKNLNDSAIESFMENEKSSQPDPLLSSGKSSETCGSRTVENEVQKTVESNQSVPKCSEVMNINSSHQPEKNNVSGSPYNAFAQNGQTQNPLKSAFCISGSTPSNNSSGFLNGNSPISMISKMPILSSDVPSLDVNEASTIPQVEIDSLSSNLVTAIENASSVLSTGGKENEEHDLLSDELMKSSEKSIEECKALVESVIHQKKDSESDETLVNVKSDPHFSPKQNLQSVESEKMNIVESSSNSSSLSSFNTLENADSVNQSHAKVLSALEDVCKLSESPLSSLHDKIQNVAKAASESVFVTRAEEVADLEIKKIPPLHKDMVDEVLVNSFELPVDEQSKDKFIDMLIEQETAKLILSDNESIDDSDESTNNDLESNVKGISPGLFTKPDTNEQSPFSSDDENASYIIEEPTPKKNVTFKLDFRDCDDNENEGGVEFVEITDEEDEAQDSGGEELSDESKFIPVERKFERMASQTLDEAEKNNPTFDREYQRIVSQLSNEEVDECLLIWDECAFAPGKDRPSKRKQPGEMKNAVQKEGI